LLVGLGTLTKSGGNGASAGSAESAAGLGVDVKSGGKGASSGLDAEDESLSGGSGASSSSSLTLGDSLPVLLALGGSDFCPKIPV
jgi:hypothetical protein